MKIINKTLIALSIGLSFASQAADDRYIIQVEEGKVGLAKALAKKLGGQVNVENKRFIAATFKGKNLKVVQGLMKNPHITLIEEDAKRELLSLYSDDIGDPSVSQVKPYAVFQSQADQLTFQDNTATKVCIIDSGLDRSNTDFNWESITGDNDSGTGNWDENGGPHGTHVAGTVGAADNDYGVVGMAPGVPMHIIKVFNAEGWGYSSDLAHAASLCAESGANIINMSLGGGRPTVAEENAFKAFEADGGLVIAAAGNDGNETRFYPAGYKSVMMVGANDADNNIANFSQFPACSSYLVGKGKKAKYEVIDSTCVEVTAGGVGTLSTYPAGMVTMSVLMADELVVASTAMTGSVSGEVAAETYYMGLGDTVDESANGKICLIDRGVITFHEKALNCESSGGLAAVVMNNEPGMVYGTLGEDSQVTIPSVGATQEDSATLRAAASVEISIAASDYGMMSGTSMATPAVSGLAALLWSNNPECTGSDIRAALKATALDAGERGRDDKFGYGIAKVADAHAYLADKGCGVEEPLAPIELSASDTFSKGKYRVELLWTGGESRRVDVYRNGLIQTTTSNDGSYTDAISNAYGTYTYSVCEAGSNHCSANISVAFE